MGNGLRGICEAAVLEGRHIDLSKLRRRLGLGAQVCFLGELPFSWVLAAFRAAHIFVRPCVVAGMAARM